MSILLDSFFNLCLFCAHGLATGHIFQAFLACRISSYIRQALYKDISNGCTCIRLNTWLVME